MKVAQFARTDDGQALVIVAIAMIALMGALALTLDWGYGYVQRRGMQNAVDNATLAAGRHVASTFKLVSGAPAFGATLEDVCDGVAAHTASLGAVTAISFFSDPADPGTWTTVATSACASVSGVPVPNDTIFVRVRSTGTFRSLTQQTITIAASARARLTGSAGCVGIDCTALPPVELPSTTQPPTAPRQGVSGFTTGPNVAIWPLALHLDLDDFRGSPCGQFCDASVPSKQIHVWPPKDQYGPSGQLFTGLLTYTHFSPRENDAGSSSVHQFTTESDYTGTTNLGIRQAHDHDNGTIYPPVRMPTADTAACGGSDWDTLGRPGLSDASTKDCDLPNWFAYGFRGSVGASTDWSSSFNGLPGGSGADRPEELSPSRASCDRSVYLPRPSCTAALNRIGDWIETVPGDMTPLMANQMLAFVAKYGRVVPNTPSLGKAVVVYIPLWDCGEQFYPGATGNDRWRAIVQGRGGDPDEPADCSQLKKDRNNTVDRVHIAAVVPFTFYEGLITTSPVEVHGVWGDVFGDAGICADNPSAGGCALNQIMNSAFLVPDD